jgi:hypothetical protein
MVYKEDEMNSMFKKGIILCIIVMIAFVQIGCKKEGKKEGTAEKTGKEIDKALDTAKDKINDVTK